jgi:signal transduction histidine kinase
MHEQDRAPRDAAVEEVGGRRAPQEAHVAAEIAELRQQVFHLQRLAQAGLLAGGLAHDARNLLAAISGTCQLATADEHRDPAEAFAHVQMIAERAARSMEVFLAFVRRGGSPNATCVVEEIVSDAVRFLGSVLGRGRVTLNRSVEQGLRVRGEPALLGQVVVNLVSNAIQAIGGEAGSVTIVAVREKNDVVVDVADDGPGVPEDVLPTLFQAFSTGRAEKGGTGLGLHTARRIAEQHGGALSLLDTRPGRTVFRLVLPALPASPGGGKEVQS